MSLFPQIYHYFFQFIKFSNFVFQIKTINFSEMKISEETVNHIAHLARLKFEGAETKSIQEDLQNMISFMDKLNELDTENLEPLVFMSDEINVLREDVAVETLSQNEALKNAPKKDSDYFRIPKVLSKK